MTLRTVACQAPLSKGVSRQEYWSGLPCPPPGDLPDPGIELASFTSPALQVGSLRAAPAGRSGIEHGVAKSKGEISTDMEVGKPGEKQ